MDLGALDGALEPWRRRREGKAWERVQALKLRERELRYAAHVARLEAASSLGKLGEHASAAAGLEREAGRVQRVRRWWQVHRLSLRRYEERRKRCGEWAYEGTCQHCGLMHAFPRACGATMVCADCAQRKARRLYRRLMPAVRLQVARGEAKWHAAGRPTGQRPVLTLCTLTVRSTNLEDLPARRALLSDAWNRFRTWWQMTYGKRLSYAWTAECTDGANDQGHVHLHAVVMLPLVSYPKLNAAWQRAVGEQGGHIDFQRRRCDVKAAARYVAKYASKGVKFARVQTAAAWVVAQHGKRGVSSSRDFWAPEDAQHGPWVLRLVRGRETVADGTHPAPPERHHGTDRDDQSSARAGP